MQKIVVNHFSVCGMTDMQDSYVQVSPMKSCYHV